jgi:hypothetical protein
MWYKEVGVDVAVVWVSKQIFRRKCKTTNSTIYHHLSNKKTLKKVPLGDAG